MGLMDKAKDFANNNPDKVNQGIEKAGDMVDSKTDGKYASQVDTAQEKIGEHLTGGAQGGAGEDQPPA